MPHWAFTDLVIWRMWFSRTWRGVRRAWAWIRAGTESWSRVLRSTIQDNRTGGDSGGRENGGGWPVGGRTVQADQYRFGSARNRSMTFDAPVSNSSVSLSGLRAWARRISCSVASSSVVDTAFFESISANCDKRSVGRSFSRSPISARNTRTGSGSCRACCTSAKSFRVRMFSGSFSNRNRPTKLRRTQACVPSPRHGGDGTAGCM